MNEEEYEDVAVAWSGVCEGCLATYAVYPHPEMLREDAEVLAEGPPEWEAFPSCFICDGSIDWNGSDPVSAVIRNA